MDTGFRHATKSKLTLISRFIISNNYDVVVYDGYVTYAGTEDHYYLPVVADTRTLVEVGTRTTLGRNFDAAISGRLEVPGPTFSRVHDLNTWVMSMSAPTSQGPFLLSNLPKSILDQLPRGVTDKEVSIDSNTFNFLTNTASEQGSFTVEQSVLYHKWGIAAEDAISLVQFGTVVAGSKFNRSDIATMLDLDQQSRLCSVPSNIPTPSRYNGGRICRAISDCISEHKTPVPVDEVSEYVLRRTGFQVNNREMLLLSSEMGGFTISDGYMRAFI